jgi:hypothetical protein
MTAMGDVDGELKTVPARECEHMAALIKSAADLPPLLVSFFRLGAARNGWLVHGSLAGEVEADRSRLAEAGLDIEALEAAGQLAILELDLTVSPEEWVDPWSTRLDEKLASGFDALWFTRFPIDPTEDAVSEVLPFEAAWMDRFHGRRVVTLCPYITGGLTGARRASHAARVAAVHDRILDHA